MHLLGEGFLHSLDLFHCFSPSTVDSGLVGTESVEFCTEGGFAVAVGSFAVGEGDFSFDGILSSRNRQFRLVVGDFWRER